MAEMVRKFREEAPVSGSGSDDGSDDGGDEDKDTGSHRGAEPAAVEDEVRRMAACLPPLQGGRCFVGCSVAMCFYVPMCASVPAPNLCAM